MSFAKQNLGRTHTQNGRLQDYAWYVRVCGVLFLAVHPYHLTRPHPSGKRERNELQSHNTAQHNPTTYNSTAKRAQPNSTTRLDSLLAVAIDRHGRVGLGISDQTDLAVALRQHVSGGGVPQYVPILGAVVGALGKLELLGRDRRLRFFVSFFPLREAHVLREADAVLVVLLVVGIFFRRSCSLGRPPRGRLWILYLPEAPTT